MIGYFDASALVKRYVEESGSQLVRRLLKQCLVCTSRLSEVEIASALVRRAREGSVTAKDRDRGLEALSRDMKAFYVVELFPEIVQAARGLLLRHRLRASDAVQLASSTHLRDSAMEKIVFVAFDDGLNDAAANERFALPHKQDQL